MPEVSLTLKNWLFNTWCNAIQYMVQCNSIHGAMHLDETSNTNTNQPSIVKKKFIYKCFVDEDLRILVNCFHFEMKLRTIILDEYKIRYPVRK